MSAIGRERETIRTTPAMDMRLTPELLKLIAEVERKLVTTPAERRAEIDRFRQGMHKADKTPLPK